MHCVPTNHSLRDLVDPELGAEDELATLPNVGPEMAKSLISVAVVLTRAPKASMAKAAAGSALISRESVY
jgi:hypothetical protein